MSTRPISVAELLAKNGTIGAPPVTGRRRRRRGNSNAVSVAELTGEIPVIRDDEDRQDHNGTGRPRGVTHAHCANGAPRTDAPLDGNSVDTEDRSELDAESEPCWPESAESATQPPWEPGSDAEQMSPDPADDFAEAPVDVMETEVADAELPMEDSADTEEHLADDATDDYRAPTRLTTLLRGSLTVLQSILAVAFGAGLFIAFDQLWQWNSIVALVLAVLVILGLVVAVQMVRKTEDKVSTLFAVAVGALVTFGPLAFLQAS